MESLSPKETGFCFQLPFAIQCHASIQVNAIAPGVIKTRFSRLLWQTPQIAEPTLAHLLLGRFGEPEDVAGLALYLASLASDYVIGVVSVVGGGMNVGSFTRPYNRGLTASSKL